MRKRIKNILKQHYKALLQGVFLCTALLISTSCTSDGEIIPGSEPEESLRAGYLSLSINSGMLSPTRLFYPVAGKPAETNVNSVRVVLYDGSVPVEESKVKYAFDYDIKTNKDTSPGYWTDNSADGKDLSPVSAKFTADNFSTYARKIVRQPYRMLVIVNPVETLRALTAQGESFADVSRAVTLDPLLLTEAGGIAFENNFLMLNEQGLVDIPEDWIQETINRAHQLPVQVSVDRVVAKVTLLPKGINGITVSSPGAKISDFTWDLDIVNKKTYWFRQMDDTEIPGIYHPDGTTIQPAMDREERYAVDPNFDGFIGVGREADRRDEFFSYTSLVDDAPAALPRILGDTVYCLENTMSIADQKDEVVTRALIRCAYKPANVSSGESYYIFNDERVITKAEMAEYVRIIKTTDQGVWGDDPYYGILYQMIDAARHGPYPEIGTETEPPAAFNFMHTINSAPYTLKYYKNGINYYAVKIEHFDYLYPANPETSYGYYGIVRNMHYNVTVTDINGPGEPVIGPLEYKTRSAENKTQSSLYNLTATFGPIN